MKLGSKQAGLQFGARLIHFLDFFRFHIDWGWGYLVAFLFWYIFAVFSFFLDNLQLKFMQFTRFIANFRVFFIISMILSHFVYNLHHFHVANLKVCKKYYRNCLSTNCPFKIMCIAFIQTKLNNFS